MRKHFDLNHSYPLEKFNGTLRLEDVYVSRSDGRCLMWTDDGYIGLRR